MTNNDNNVVPVWTLATRDVSVPAILDGEAMTPARLTELRTVLAALADAPIATLEAHPAPKDLDRSRGLHLDSASPLAMHLSQLVSKTSSAAPAAGVAAAGGEVLYRMVVPAKVAAQVGSGLVKPMASKAVAGGVHSALRGSSKIAAQATFVPVAGKAAAAGAAGGAAAAGTAALTIAAPLVLMAVAVGVSAHADHKRQQAIENITTLLEQLHDDALQRERSALNGCRDAIDKATAILLDQGKIGVTLGLDSAVYAISTALAEAEERLKKWQRAITEVADRPVEIAKLRTTFDGIDEETGKFRAHLELAELAIALKKRVIVLQAVEHSQLDPSNPFEAFVGALKRDQQRVTELESGIAAVLQGLATLKLDRSHGVRDVVFSRGEVDQLLRTSYRLRELGAGVAAIDDKSDVAIEIVRDNDGSVVVLPAYREPAA
ncbi:hypothetical protein [Mycolicibacterium sp.]|uniref:hypothetical protein n=1 Tax=Mycolicibacterium sp. TaxID=2320850 RepID=UPI0037CC03AC